MAQPKPANQTEHTAIDVLSEIRKHYDASPTSLAPFAPTRVELAIIAYLQAEAERRR